ncbi:MAG: sigma-54-dependent Fis family transcriptional regulator [Ignavibacteriales bacterium]|jgi:two-component system response regulator AtoC|nr:sigma-54 dependent transcriptional regulator [Ignavibacteriaceae bacterium]NLH60731.1 sigma-54-dependent Fis family transcriptional regulator [Ignavibacteriales bacterium]HOJ17146.1 sigma-54 dependent transcriptional regulator [Ignavibacteriaceae bacterium]HPO56036.1 sigma-54 dependent transcriptional regulator [Ignavibacteriaceae bacterium]
MKVLIIEDEKITRISLGNTLTKEGFEVFSADEGAKGISIFDSQLPEIVISDLRLPDANGLDILSHVLTKNPDSKVILITAYATVETAVQALKMGAYDYLTKPFSPEKLIAVLRNIRQLQSVITENTELKNKIHFLQDRSIVGNSKETQKLRETIRHIAQNDFTILIEGESGTGKEIVARTLHNLSPRKNENFVTVSCSSIPESLLESELFGHEKGSFTGALKRHRGYFERANKGTIFLDDIDDFPMYMQVKLLRVIQEREFTRVGGSEVFSLDVRIICATKIDLKKKVDEKKFREDLFYRLNIIPLKIKPLRDRKDDIVPLVKYFFRKHSSEEKLSCLTPGIWQKLIDYDWYGNVRELENIVERMIALSYSGEIDLTLLDLPASKKDVNLTQAETSFSGSFDEFISAKEADIINWALLQTDNNITNAARLLKIPRTTLTGKIERLAISRNKSSED